MEAKELRINNIVTIENHSHHPLESGSPHVVKEIRKDSVLITLLSVGLLEYGQLNKFVKPVPLNEQWLKEFGFVEDSNIEGVPSGEFFKGLFWMLGISGNRHEYQLALGLRIPKCQPTTIRYVHQLQNLYFALTGKELEPKTDK